MTIIKYDYPDDPASSGYCVFPAALEENELVLFHATPAESRDAIFRDGFKIPDPEGVAGLPSVSFGKKSIAALTHAMTMRASRPGAYCMGTLQLSRSTGIAGQRQRHSRLQA